MLAHKNLTRLKNCPTIFTLDLIFSHESETYHIPRKLKLYCNRNAPQDFPVTKKWTLATTNELLSREGKEEPVWKRTETEKIQEKYMAGKETK